MNWLICTVALAVLLAIIIIGLFLRRPPRCSSCGRRDRMVRDGAYVKTPVFRCLRCGAFTWK